MCAQTPRFTGPIRPVRKFVGKGSSLLGQSVVQVSKNSDGPRKRRYENKAFFLPESLGF